MRPMEPGVREIAWGERVKQTGRSERVRPTAWVWR